MLYFSRQIHGVASRKCSKIVIFRSWCIFFSFRLVHSFSRNYHLNGFDRTYWIVGFHTECGIMLVLGFDVCVCVFVSVSLYVRATTQFRWKMNDNNFGNKKKTDKKRTYNKYFKRSLISCNCIRPAFFGFYIWKGAHFSRAHANKLKCTRATCMPFVIRIVCVDLCLAMCSNNSRNGSGYADNNY